MVDDNHPVYCSQCGSIAQPGDRFCGVCGARIPPDAQNAAPTQEIPTQVPPPPNVTIRRGNRTLAVVLGLGALLVALLAVGGVLALNLSGQKTAGQGGAEPKPAPTNPPSEQNVSRQDESPKTLGVGDSVKVRGIRTTLNGVRTLPTTDLDQPVAHPDNVFVATDLTFENTSEESIPLSRLLGFVLEDEDGYSASQTTHTQQRPLAEGEITANEKVSGEIVYEVPPEAKGLQLDYSPFAGKETYTWQIGDASRIPGSAQTPSAEGRTEKDLVEAVENYYEAVDREDWSYTYENLDSQSQALFTEEEWYLKNQWFADTEGLELATMDVEVNGSPSEDSVVNVTIYRTFKDGSSIDRDTFFAYEDGVWKHRLGEEEIGFFMPEASFEEFVAAQQGSSPSPSPSAPAGGGGQEQAVKDAVRGHYNAIGEGYFEKAYSYFGPTMRSRQDKASWIASEQSYEIQSSTIHSLTVDEVMRTTATATVDVSFVDNTGTPRFVIVWGLVKEGGQWKLDEQISAQRKTGTLASPPATTSSSPPSDGEGNGYPPISEDDCPDYAPIKGNQSGIYHAPGGQYYDVTDPEECFATEADARAAGYRPSKR